MIRADPRQFDMFAPPAPVVTNRPFDPDEPSQSVWKRGHEAIARGEVEALVWGKATDDMRIPHGKSGFVFLIWQDGGGLRYRTDTAVKNSWSGGPFSDVTDMSRDDLVAVVLLRKLDSCARIVAVDSENANCAGQLAAWIIEQLAPIFYPAASAAAHYAERLAVEQTERDRVLALARAKHAVEEKGKAALVAAKRWGYDKLVVDPEVEEGRWGDARFPGRWEVEGETPESLRIVIYAKPGMAKADANVIALDMLAQATGLPVRIEGRK